MDYRQKLLDGRWQRKRLQILERDGFSCQQCRRQDNVQIHHNWYLKNMEPWDYSGEQLITLCSVHHDEITEIQKKLKQLLSESGPELQKEVYEVLLAKKTAIPEFFADAPRWVLCTLVASEKAQESLICDFQVMDEDGNTFRSRQELGIWHEERLERNRSRELFSLLCRATGVSNIKDSGELHGIKCWGHFVDRRISCFRHIAEMSWGDDQ